MSEIKRYSLIDCVVGKGYMATITEDPGGAWVKYADHAAEVEMLNTKIASLRETIDELTLYQAQRDGYARQRVELAAKDAEIVSERLASALIRTENEKLKAEIENLNGHISAHIHSLQEQDAEIAALTKALDEATMLLHEFQTDCGWDTTLERDFANIKTPASRALCERLFGGAK